MRRACLAAALVAGCSSPARPVVKVGSDLPSTVTALDGERAMVSLAEAEQRQLCEDLARYTANEVTPADTSAVVCVSRALVAGDDSPAQCRSQQTECRETIGNDFGPLLPPCRTAAQPSTLDADACGDLVVGDLTGCHVEGIDAMHSLAALDVCADQARGREALRDAIARQSSPRCEAVRPCLATLYDLGRGTPKPPAHVALNRLGKAAKAYFYDVGAFPVGQTGLSPATPCCTQPGAVCAPTAATWTDQVWTALEYTLDEPVTFQLSYQGTADHFVATAVGPRACGEPVETLRLEGRVENGAPVLTAIEAVTP